MTRHAVSAAALAVAPIVNTVFANATDFELTGDLVDKQSSAHAALTEFVEVAAPLLTRDGAHATALEALRDAIQTHVGTAPPPSNPIPREAYSVEEWCTAFGISQSFFYKLPEDQRPPTLHLGRRRLITRQASLAWQERMIKGLAA